MLTLQVTFPFIYHQAIKKFCDGKTVKKPGPSLVPPGQKIAFLFSGDAERFHLSYQLTLEVIFSFIRHLTTEKIWLF